MKSALVSLLFIAAALLTYVEVFVRPALLLVGNITVDVVDQQRLPGGAVTYAAQIARAYGVRACIVTAAADDADLPMFDGHELHVVRSNATLTFEHTYTWFGNHRKLRVLAVPNVTLTAQHVPLRCRFARTVLLGPLIQHDVDAASFLSHDTWWEAVAAWRQSVGLMAQGLQRRLDSNRRVVPFNAPSPQLMAGLNQRKVVLFLSDVETESWSAAAVAHVATSCARMLVTRGEHGANETRGGATFHVPSIRVDAKDTNGAGDTFATAYMLAAAAMHPHPAAEATYAASRAVMQPQSCKPACVSKDLQGRRMWHATLTSMLRVLSVRCSAVQHGIAAWVAAKVGVADGAKQEL